MVRDLLQRLAVLGLGGDLLQSLECLSVQSNKFPVRLGLNCQPNNPSGLEGREEKKRKEKGKERMGRRGEDEEDEKRVLQDFELIWGNKT